MINFQHPDIWKIQLTVAINFISSKDTDEERVMHLRSDNKKSASYGEVNDVIGKLFESLRSNYQDRLETSMKGSDFIFDLVQLMHYKCHKVNFKLGSPYIHSADWVKKKKSNNKSKK